MGYSRVGNHKPAERDLDGGGGFRSDLQRPADKLVLNDVDGLINTRGGAYLLGLMRWNILSQALYLVHKNISDNDEKNANFNNLVGYRFLVIFLLIFYYY